MNNTILNDINQIEELTLEAEMNTLFALCDCYEKQAMILENTECDNLSEFSVFQEGLFEREEGESKLKTIALLPLRLIGFMVKMFTKFVKKCRDTIKTTRIEFLFSKFKFKLKKEEGIKDLLRYLNSDSAKLARFKIKCEDGEPKCLFKPFRDPKVVQKLIDRFDITDIKDEDIYNANFYGMYYGEPILVEDYLKKIERMCNTIEKVILKQLNEQLEIFKNIGSVEEIITPSGATIKTDPVHYINDVKFNLRLSIKRWSDLLKVITDDIDACTTLYKKLEEYMNEHGVYFDGEKKKKR